MEKIKEMVILLAEDDEGHAELIKIGLLNSGVMNTIIHFRNGKECWNFLSGKSEGENRDPDKNYLLLLDINMPEMDGVETLKRMKNDDVLKFIPVIMLTTTDDPREIGNCYALGCNVYVTKPIDFTEFAEKLKRLGLFIQIVSV